MLFVTICSAQSLKFMDDAGNDIDGTVHHEYEYSSTGFNGFHATFQLENLSSISMYLKVKLEKGYVPYTNSSLIMVAGTWMDAANPNVAGAQSIGFSDSVLANGLYSFRLFPSDWMWVNANDSAVWSVTFYDAQDTTDSVSATIIWKKEVYTESPVSVEENITLNKFNVFPNPVIGSSFTISNLNEDSEEAVLYDVSGREVGVYVIDEYEDSLNVSVIELDAGIYFCTVKGAGNILKTQKIIIN